MRKRDIIRLYASLYGIPTKEVILKIDKTDKVWMSRSKIYSGEFDSFQEDGRNQTESRNLLGEKILRESIKRYGKMGKILRRVILVGSR